MNRVHRSLALIGLGLAWTWGAASAQSFVALTPTQYLDAGAGCFSFRCFMSINDLEGTTAITSNTGPSVAIQIQGSAPIWTVQQVLTNPDYRLPPDPYSAAPWQQFGYPVGFSGDSLLVAGTSPRYNMKDVLYVYRRSGGRWTHLQTITLQRPADYDRTMIDTIALDGEWAVVGATRIQDAGVLPEFAQFDVYKRNPDGTYSRRGGFKPPRQPSFTSISEIAIKGNVIAIADSYASNQSGRVYIYEYGAGGWQYRRTLSAPSPAAGAHFGQSISLDNGFLAVSEPDRADVRPEHLGAVHMFERTSTQWRRMQTLVGPIDPRITGYTLGPKLSLSGSRLLIGKYPNEFSEGVDSMAYLYERRERRWLPIAEFVSGNGDVTTDVAISGNLAVVTATDFAYNRPGYVFELPALNTLPALTQ